MQVTRRTRMTAAERREQLLDVTKALVGELGFHGVSIEAVARRAGISRPIVYGHFDDLATLLTAMLERETARALAQVAALLPPDPGEEREAALLACQRAFLDAVQADPVTWRLVLMPPEGAPEQLRARIEEGREEFIAMIRGVVGPAASPDPELTARLLSRLSEEGARLLLTDPERYPLERLMAQTQWLLSRLAG